MSTKEWIEERRTIHEAATGGPWIQDTDDGVIGLDVYTDGRNDNMPDRWERQDPDIRTESADDAGFIVDAHNMFPRALDALNAVLELLDAWEPPDPCAGPDITKCIDCLQAQEMRKAIEGAINE